MTSAPPAKTRTLGAFERAAALTDSMAPFQAAVALTLDTPLNPEAVGRALTDFVRSQPFLSMRPEGGRFEACGVEAPELLTLDGDEGVADAAVDALFAERPADRGDHPVRARLVTGGGASTLVIAAPHYLVDAVSLGELAFAAVGASASKAPMRAIPPPIEARFSAAWRGWRGALAVARFASVQLAADAGLRFERIGARAPPAPAVGRSRSLVRTLDGGRLARLSTACRRRGVTLNGLLAAAAGAVFLRRFLGRESGRVSLMGFRDLRARVAPRVPEGEMGADFAILRHVVPIRPDGDWASAIAISEIIAASGRRGDGFAAFLAAPALVGAALRLRMRYGDIAVSTPAVRWPKSGALRGVRRFAGYVSANPLAPPVSLLAAQSPAGLALTFTYLESEFRADEVAGIAEAVVARLIADTEGRGA